MKYICLLSSVVWLSACADSIDAPSIRDTASEEVIELTASSGDIWDTPRRLRSVYSGDRRIALQYEAAGKEPALTVIAENTWVEDMRLDVDAFVVSRSGEYLGQAFYESGVVGVNETVMIDLDLSSIAFDTYTHGLFYTLILSTDGVDIPLDFYMGEPLDLIADTPNWYDELVGESADDTMSEDERELIDWIKRHE